MYKNAERIEYLRYLKTELKAELAFMYVLGKKKNTAAYLEWISLFAPPPKSNIHDWHMAPSPYKSAIL